MALESLTGKELAFFIANLNEGVRDISPCLRLFITQSLLEPLLKARAEELGAELRFATEMVSFEQDRDGVATEIRHRDTGEVTRVRSKYLIAADGSHSRIREKLGIRMLGRGVFSKSVTIYFKGDVSHLLRGRNMSVMYVLNPTLSGFFRIEKPFTSGFLAVHWLGDPKNPVTDVSSGLTEERAIALLRSAIGDEDVPLAIENIMPWDATADTAEHFQQGRIFLVGDAAHVMPPSGGFGGNTGVQDAQNLAWKLAFVLKGLAGPELLASYEIERRPASAFTVEQAYSRYVLRSAPYLKSDDLQAIESDLPIECGYCYDSKAIVFDADGPPPARTNPRDSKARPGSRAPHLYLEKDGAQISTLDLFGTNFTLLAGPEADAWSESARSAAQESKVPLDIFRIGNSAGRALRDRSGDLPAAYGMSPSGAVLVRPDGFVAWRAKTSAGASAAKITSALVSILSVESRGKSA